MATNINFGVVNAQIGKIENNYDDVISGFSKIANNYINRVNSIWSSAKAEEYYNELVSALNETNDSINKALVEGAFKGIHAASKHMSDAEKGIHIRDVSGNKIAAISKNWTGNDTSFKIPSTESELTNFTNSNFTSNANAIKTHLTSIKSSLISIKDNGLSDYISGSFINEVNKAIAKIDETINTYDERNTKNMATQDANARGYRMTK